MIKYKNMTVEEIVEWLKEGNSDKMLLEDADGFTRGKLAGKVELIEEFVFMLTEVDEDEEQEDG